MLIIIGIIYGQHKVLHPCTVYVYVVYMQTCMHGGICMAIYMTTQFVAEL